ncbi:MAG TPA: hypothetical protein VHZ76_09630 [Gammaproteobacteria bacterium]|jgi:hypothetical protein|nr:hypothetical protein [Gammaproteobacteria bacterium]
MRSNNVLPNVSLQSLFTQPNNSNWRKLSLLFAAATFFAEQMGLAHAKSEVNNTAMTISPQIEASNMDKNTLSTLLIVGVSVTLIAMVCCMALCSKLCKRNDVSLQPMNGNNQSHDEEKGLLLAKK